MFDLGILYENCNLNTVSSNRHVRGTIINRILDNICDLTKEHRRTRNFLLHRGQRIKSLPIGELNLEHLRDPIKKFLEPDGIDVNDDLLKEILSEADRNELITFMRSEYRKLNIIVLELFNELLPYYHKIHKSYSD